MRKLESVRGTLLLVLCLCICMWQGRVEGQFQVRSWFQLEVPLVRRPMYRAPPYGYLVQGGQQEEVVEVPVEGSNDTASSAGSSSSTASSKEPGRLFGTRKNEYKRQSQLTNRLAQIRASAQTIFQQVPLASKKEQVLSTLGPSMLAFWTNRGGNQVVSFGTLYALTLLGSSVGFYSFLYFISVGYALGITLPLLVALYRWNLNPAPRHPSNPSTLLHSALVIAWGIRALLFFLWREHINWPALHRQIRYVNQHNAPALPVKCLIWILYSFVYTAMLSPCWFRLQLHQQLTSTTTNNLILLYLPILLQITGLTLETIADSQKSSFKTDNRYEWCNVGLWKWSTHPNYLGEMIFWTGTYFGWLFVTLFSASKPFSWWGKLLFTTLGYTFIIAVLRGSIASMGQKHWQKYGHIPEYAQFRQSHGLLGPKRHAYYGTQLEFTPYNNETAVLEEAPS